MRPLGVWALRLVVLVVAGASFLVAANSPDSVRSLVVAWVIGTVLLAGAWVLLRHWRATRPCPRCGRGVRVGELECAACGFDFRSIGGTPPRP